MRKHSLGIIFVVFVLCGCQSLQPAQKKPGTRENVQSAVSSVTEAVAGRPLTEQERKNFEKQMKNDPQTRSAVEAIRGAYAHEPARVKYCPKDGKRYAPKLEMCPEHGVPLQWVDE